MTESMDANLTNMLAGKAAGVTVIATGFGGRPRRRRIEAAVPTVSRTDALSERRPDPPTVTDTEIEIPSFLRED